MLAFIIMPFDEELTAIYQTVIKPVLEEMGCEVQRADEITTHQNILKDIVRGIHRADLIIADLTGNNANVFYELGIAHGLNRPTVLITQNLDDLPFDLRSYRVVNYSADFRDIERLKNSLKGIVSDYKIRTLEVGNPVSDFLSDYSSPSLKISDRTEVSVDEEYDEMGLWDYIDEVNTSLSDLTAIIERIFDLVVTLSSSINSRTGEVQLIQASGVSKSSMKVRKVIKSASDDLMSFADGLRIEMPRFRQAWDTFKSNISGVFNLTAIQTPEDQEELENFRDIVQQLQSKVAESLIGIRSMRDALPQLRRISKDLNRSVSVAEREMDELIEGMVTGESYLVRIIELSNEKLKTVVDNRDIE